MHLPRIIRKERLCVCVCVCVCVWSSSRQRTNLCSLTQVDTRHKRTGRPAGRQTENLEHALLVGLWKKHTKQSKTESCLVDAAGVAAETAMPLKAATRLATVAQEVKINTQSVQKQHPPLKSLRLHPQLFLKTPISTMVCFWIMILHCTCACVCERCGREERERERFRERVCVCACL